MPVVFVDLASSAHEVGAQLSCRTASGQPSKKDLSAAWVSFPFCSVKETDGRVVSAAESRLRQYLERGAEAESRLDSLLSHAIGPSFESRLLREQVRLQAAGCSEFQVVIGSMNPALRTADFVESGKCVRMPLQEFLSGLRDGSTLQVAKSVFYALNDDVMRHLLRAIESAKTRHPERYSIWNADIRQPDGVRFSYAFSERDDGSMPVILVKGVSKKLINGGLSVEYSTPLGYDPEVAAQAVCSRHESLAKASLSGVLEVIDVRYDGTRYEAFRIESGRASHLSGWARDELFSNMKIAPEHLSSLRPLVSVAAPQAA